MLRMKFSKLVSRSVKVGLPSIPYTQKVSGPPAAAASASAEEEPPFVGPFVFMFRCSRPNSGLGFDPRWVNCKAATSRWGRGKASFSLTCRSLSAHNGLHTSTALSTKYPMLSPMFVPKSIKAFLQTRYGASLEAVLVVEGGAGLNVILESRERSSASFFSRASAESNFFVDASSVLHSASPDARHCLMRTASASASCDDDGSDAVVALKRAPSGCGGGDCNRATARRAAATRRADPTKARLPPPLLPPAAVLVSRVRTGMATTHDDTARRWSCPPLTLCVYTQ